MRITIHRLQNENFGRQWVEEVEDHWRYADFKHNARWRNGWISFDCILHNPADDLLYLGITSFAGDISGLLNPAQVSF